MRACAFWADGEAVMRPAANRAATGGDGFDVHGRREELHAGDILREAIAGTTGDAGHVGAGAAHVERDDLIKAEASREIGRADGSTGRSAEQHVLWADVVGGFEASGARHDLHRGRDAADGIQKRLHRTMQISIGDRALGARQQFSKGSRLMRQHDMREAALA